MVASASRKSVTWLRKASTFDLPVKGTLTISRTRNRAGLASLLDQRLQSCLIKHGCTISKGRRITRSHRQVDSVLAKIQRPLSSALSFGKVRIWRDSDPLGCTLEFRLLRRCRRDMLAASFSLHYPKLPFRMTLANGRVGWFCDLGKWHR
jgi:hypothetical protein